MNRIADLFDLWPSEAEIARAVGVHPRNVWAWKNRRSIPVEHWAALIHDAEARGIEGVNAEMLVSIHATPKDEPEAA